MPPLYVEPGWPLHTGQEIGIDDFQATRAPDNRYRTAPLRGLWTRLNGPGFTTAASPTSAPWSSTTTPTSNSA